MLLSRKSFDGGEFPAEGVRTVPIVQIEMLEGRTVEQKRALAEKLTEVICETLHCPATAVSIIMRDMSPSNYATGGKLRVDQ